MTTSSAYHAGRHARDQKKPADPPYRWCSSRFWWHAGWNDRDMELSRG